MNKYLVFFFFTIQPICSNTYGGNKRILGSSKMLISKVAVGILR